MYNTVTTVHNTVLCVYIYFWIFYLFLERGEGREKENNIDV